MTGFKIKWQTHVWMFLKNLLVPRAAGILVSLLKKKFCQQWRLDCYAESLRFCFMGRVRETCIDLSKIFSREWRKSERIPPNLLPVVRFKISFPSIPNSCFSFCYDTIWRADFAELAYITKPILVKFLSCFLSHFLLLTGRLLWYWEGKNFSELTRIGKLKK